MCYRTPLSKIGMLQIRNGEDHLAAISLRQHPQPSSPFGGSPTRSRSFTGRIELQPRHRSSSGQTVTASTKIGTPHAIITCHLMSNMTQVRTITATPTKIGFGPFNILGMPISLNHHPQPSSPFGGSPTRLRSFAGILIQSLWLFIIGGNLDCLRCHKKINGTVIKIKANTSTPPTMIPSIAPLSP